MKFKKTLTLIFIAILSFVLIACEDKSYMQEAIAEVDMLMEDLGFENGDTFSLINKYQSVTITWESMDLDIIDQNGDVNSIGLNTDVEVMIVVTFTEGKVIEERNYFVMVYKIDNTDPDPDPDPDPEPDPDEADREKINLVKNSLNLPETTRTNLDLVTLSNGVVLSWASDHEAITSEGIVTRSEDEDIEVTLTVTLTSGNVTDTKEFVVIVEREDVLTEAKNSLVLPSSTDKNLELPLTTGKDNLVTVTWESNNVEVITHAGVVNRSLNEDITVTLTATLTYKEQTPQTRDFEVVVLKDPLLDEVIDNLEVPTDVVRDLILPASVQGVSITWSSNNPAIATNGVVTRGEADTPVTLTASLSYKGIEREITFDVIVKQMPTTKLNSPDGIVVQTTKIVLGAFTPDVGYGNQIRFVWYLNGVATADDIKGHTSGGYDYLYESFLDSLEPGTYTVKVQYLSDGTALDSDLVNVPGTFTKTGPILDGFTLTLDANQLTWDEVSNAENYSIYVDNVFITETNVTSYEIDPEVLELSYGDHTFKVVATASGYGSSEASTTYEYINENAVRLDTPTNVSVDSETGVLTWDAVAHAIGYRLAVGTTVRELGNVTTFELTTLNLNGGEHTISLVAIGDGQEYLNSIGAEAIYNAPQPVAQIDPIPSGAIGNIMDHPNTSYIRIIIYRGQINIENWSETIKFVIRDGSDVLFETEIVWSTDVYVSLKNQGAFSAFAGVDGKSYTMDIILVGNAGYRDSEPVSRNFTY